jgi:hypothetical protein
MGHRLAYPISLQPASMSLVALLFASMLWRQGEAGRPSLPKGQNMGSVESYDGAAQLSCG